MIVARDEIANAQEDGWVFLQANGLCESVGWWNGFERHSAFPVTAAAPRRFPITARTPRRRSAAHAALPARA